MLSILEREMRVTARKRRTFLMRIVTTLAMFFIGAALIAMGQPGGGSGTFNVITFLGFWICLLDGVRRAAGSIADEKRDGTLGLLFLTDLRPIEIILGKMFAVMIPVLQPLLAFAPILSICLLLGGVMGSEVLRAMLVLGSTLFFSISIGLFISAVSRQAQDTGNKTALLLFGAVLLPTFFHGRLDLVQRLTPLTAYGGIREAGFLFRAGEFWWSLGATAAISVAAILAAAFFLPRRWNEQKANSAGKSRTGDSLKPRARFLQGNPGEWLAARYAMTGRQEFFFTATIVVIVGFAGFSASESREGAVALGVLAIGAAIVLLRLASQASYPLAEARRSGAIEMILSTPLRPEEFLNGHKRTLFNQFLPALATLVAASFICPTFGDPGAEFFVFSAIFCAFLLVGAGAFAYVGMWMGLKHPKPNTAFFYTIALLGFVPLLGLCFMFVFAWPVTWVILWIVGVVKTSNASLLKISAANPP